MTVTQRIDARMNGAKVAIVGGRRGWVRAWKLYGYSFLQKSEPRHHRYRRQEGWICDASRRQTLLDRCKITYGKSGQF
jgi:hypothetical protein